MIWGQNCHLCILSLDYALFILDLMGIVSKVSELLYVLFDGFAALSPWERILMHALWTMQV
jgi:hypothetical protein